MRFFVLVTLAAAMAVSARPARGANGAKGAAAAGAKGAAATAPPAAAAAAGAAAAAANATASTASANNKDLQNSLTLDPSVLATGFLNNGQAVAEAGQVASLTSGNNFINFCATVPNLPITNGKQITTGSCNPAPMGIIPSTANMPSAKFTFPQNNGVVAPNTPFTISLAVQNFETGNFVNAQQNYFAAPQQLNAQGQVVGHSHVVVEALTSLTQTTPTDPTKFAFFKGLNAAAVGGILTADVTAGLPAGTYKVSTINTAANHQPILVPIAQHGSLDDVVYFTVSANGAAAAAGAGAAANGAGAAAAASPAAASVAAAAGGKGGKGAKGAAAAASSAAAASPAAASVAAAAGGKGAKGAAAAAAAAAASSAAAGTKGAKGGSAAAKGAAAGAKGAAKGAKKGRSMVRARRL